MVASARQISSVIQEQKEFYTVQKNDNLWKIASKHLQAEGLPVRNLSIQREVQRLISINPHLRSHPNLLRPGQQIFFSDIRHAPLVSTPCNPQQTSCLNQGVIRDSLIESLLEKNLSSNEAKGPFGKSGVYPYEHTFQNGAVGRYRDPTPQEARLISSRDSLISAFFANYEDEIHSFMGREVLQERKTPLTNEEWKSIRTNLLKTEQRYYIVENRVRDFVPASANPKGSATAAITMIPKEGDSPAIFLDEDIITGRSDLIERRIRDNGGNPQDPKLVGRFVAWIIAHERLHADTGKIEGTALSDIMSHTALDALAARITHLALEQQPTQAAIKHPSSKKKA